MQIMQTRNHRIADESRMEGDADMQFSLGYELNARMKDVIREWDALFAEKLEKFEIDATIPLTTARTRDMPMGCNGSDKCCCQRMFVQQAVDHPNPHRVKREVEVWVFGLLDPCAERVT